LPTLHILQPVEEDAQGRGRFSADAPSHLNMNHIEWNALQGSICGPDLFLLAKRIKTFSF
jgi:hypothetical protein